jgi:hypothetical protein
MRIVGMIAVGLILAGLAISSLGQVTEERLLRLEMELAALKANSEVMSSSGDVDIGGY